MSRAADELNRIVEPTVTSMGYELVGIEYLGQGRHTVVRIYIDSDNGITVDDCGDVSHQVSALFDVEDPIKGPYTLEVSSPGLDRPLFTAEHFARFTGNVVQLRTHRPLNGRRKFKGLLKGIDDNGVITLDVDGLTVEIDFNEVEKAQLVPEW